MGKAYSIGMHRFLSFPSFKMRSNCPEVFCKKGVLKNFTKLTGKHLCQSLFSSIFSEREDINVLHLNCAIRHSFNQCSCFDIGINLVYYEQLQEATRLYFKHYSCVVIILFNTGLYKSAYSTYSFGKLTFSLSLSLSALFVFSACSVSNTMFFCTDL